MPLFVSCFARFAKHNGISKKGGITQAAETTIASALSTSFTAMATDIMDTIGTVLPIILPILGAIAVIGVGIKVFKKVTGR